MSALRAPRPAWPHPRPALQRGQEAEHPRPLEDEQAPAPGGGQPQEELTAPAGSFAAPPRGRRRAPLAANSIVAAMPDVRIRDTRSGDVRPLQPREPPQVGVYACGPTVYSRIHVGNARAFVIPMLLRRLLAHEGYEPRLVINVTDINDKIYAAAAEAGVPSDRLAREMTRAYVEDTDRLALGRPDDEPLASDTIGEIVDLIETLIERDHAYESGGDVYFRVRSFPGYGKLSNRAAADMDQGEEAGTESLKEDRLDFALWKARKADEDSGWPSPWGEGRPGWHIE